MVIVKGAGLRGGAREVVVVGVVVAVVALKA